MGTRSSEFRDALQISPERIAALDDSGLNELMRDLLKAQAYLCKARLSEIIVNTEGRAKDDGCDGWSPKPESADDWLGASNTCWQFKAGSAGEPARLRGEVIKSIPRETLSAGGRFVVVASSSTNGKKGEDGRLTELRDEAKVHGIPVEGIEVIGSERLATWCNQHPAVASRWAGRPSGLVTLSEWARDPEHQAPWHARPGVDQLIAEQRCALDFTSGSTVHMHIEGQPGVGKTRFALEVCREAEWGNTVVYFRQATDHRLVALIDDACTDKSVRLLIVADEVQTENLMPLREAISRGEGRVRLITIGHCLTPDPRRIPALSVPPLERQQMMEIVKGWYPSMPPEHADFVVRFADGYVRLARLAADAVARTPALDVRGLLELSHIREFLNRMLGPGNRRSLHVVAVLSRVGWTEDRSNEGAAVAQHLGLDWNSVRADVEDFHCRLGIVPRGGRYRYVSPTPLGIYIAVDAWNTYPDLMRSLPDALPTDGARTSYFDRLRSIASNPQAREYAQEQLQFFFRLSDFVDVRSARRWSAFSSANPDLAARNARRALADAPPEERARIAGDARREVVSTLVRLSWQSSAFRDAAVSLALLAEAENETWANNSTGEFIGKFRVFLGGTAVPYTERLLVLDDVCAIGSPALSKLVVLALAQVGNQHESRVEGEPPSDEVPEPEWHPKNVGEHIACIERALSRLRLLAEAGQPYLKTDLILAADKLAVQVRSSALRPLVAEYYEAVRAAYPDAREPLRRSIAQVISSERRHWKELAAEELAKIEALHHRFEDESLAGRLRQYVGGTSWDRRDQIDLSSIAAELLEEREVLALEWPWLTSGEAGGSWRLGEALAIADTSGKYDAVLPELGSRGPDLRVLSGYANQRQKEKGSSWLDAWMSGQLEQRPGDTDLLLEICWRCGMTPYLADLVVARLRQQTISAEAASRLEFGSWAEDLPFTSLAELLLTLRDVGLRSTAIAILHHRLESKPAELSQWEELVLSLVTSEDVVRSEQMTGYHWKELAALIVARYPCQVASAIFRAHADRTRGSWFIRHSEAREILSQCVNAEPSGVWDELVPFLTAPAAARIFCVGLPSGLLERMPVEEVARWASEAPEERVPMLAALGSLDLASDETTASRLIDSYGEDARVAEAFFSAYVSGSWSGPPSVHWAKLAENLERVATRTLRPTLRRWAERAASSLREMAERDRRREDEEAIP